MSIGNRTTHPAYGYVDIPCIALCDAINSMDGLKTSWSCCGHGDREFMIFIKSDHTDKFAPLLYLLNRIKGWKQAKIWTIQLTARTENGGVAFLLSSESKGQEAFDEADIIAKYIVKILQPVGSDKEFDNQYNTMF